MSSIWSLLGWVRLSVSPEYRGMGGLNVVRISRGMAAVLRHGVGGVRIDSSGWVSLEELASALTRMFKTPVRRQHIMEVLRNDYVGRYELDEHSGRVRALYGHSIPVTISYRRASPGEVKLLYHGTTRERLDKILREGLRPLDRLWVHMYNSYELAAERSMRRRGKPTVLVIDAEAMLLSGYNIFRAGRYVYVAKHVPSKFIKEAKLLVDS